MTPIMMSAKDVPVNSLIVLLVQLMHASCPLTLLLTPVTVHIQTPAYPKIAEQTTVTNAATRQ